MEVRKEVQRTWQKLLGRRRRWIRWAAKQYTDATLRSHAVIVLNLVRGKTPTEIAACLNCSRSSVYRVAQRFVADGDAGLVDHREDNGSSKVTWWYERCLVRAVAGCPRDYGYHRPTWTLELLVRVLDEESDIRLSRATLSRHLKRLRIRRGRPKPIVRCPWSAPRQRGKLAWLRRLANKPPPRHVVFWSDEVDIHLNPKIGYDYMLPGTQKTVLTPGTNEKRYLAGALQHRTGRLIWVEGQRKNSVLFVALLRRLLQLYPDALVIHVILDNSSIHSSQYTQRALASFGGRIRLHPLPPYCQDANRIERFWEDLHGNVTRNHRCADMQALMGEVRYFLRNASRRNLARYYKGRKHRSAA